MTNVDGSRDEAPVQLEREIRQARKFTPQEAMARMAGPGAMKGASPVSPVEQAETEIGTWLGAHLSDPDGILRIVLRRHLRGSELLLDNLEQPLVALAKYLQRILASSHLASELVREADVEWGRVMDERPYFEKDGSPPHPDDPYTIESVRKTLSALVGRLSDSGR